MKLLIVDDQASVVQGLLKGINWAAMGFDQVDTAYNVVDAKGSIRTGPADIALCDIEMPVESGLDFLKWLRANNYRTRCIFLTAHARFEYAQEAVHLGGFDYIVQPAPYAQVKQVVAKAVEEVKLERAQEEQTARGMVFDKRKDAIVGNLLRDYLRGTAAERDLEAFESIGLLPLRGQICWAVLLQPLRWLKNEEPWELQLLSTAVGNMVREIFAPLGLLTVVTVLPEEQCLLLALQSLVGEELEIDYMSRQFIYLQSVCEQYVHVTTASYLLGPQLFSQLQQRWSLLLQCKNDNVALKKGVFPVQSTAGQAAKPMHIRQVAGWQKLMQSGYALAVEQEACQLLDTMAANNQLDRLTLRFFYQDFMQMVFNMLEKKPNLLQEMFQQPEAMELYRNGMKTIDDMKALVHYVAHSQKGGGDSDRDVVETVSRYIADHLEADLRREELAELVHLNPDYLNRLFKKEVGLTLKEYIIRRKMEQARSLLRTTNLPIGFIAAKVGYNNFSHFSNSYKKLFDRNPQEERKEV